MPYYLFHYTYGVEYSKEGLPVELQVRGLPGYHPIGGPPRRAAGARLARGRGTVRVVVWVWVWAGVGVEVAVGE